MTPATRPLMPNLEVEEQLTSSAAPTTAAATDVTTTTAVAAFSNLDKAELLMELNALSETFDDLQSRYECKYDVFLSFTGFLLCRRLHPLTTS